MASLIPGTSPGTAMTRGATGAAMTQDEIPAWRLRIGWRQWAFAGHDTGARTVDLAAYRGIIGPGEGSSPCNTANIAS